MLLTVLFGVGGGLALAALGIPAGPLLGALFASGAYSLARNAAVQIPRSVQLVAKIVMGSVIGSVLSRELFADLGRNVVWALLFTAVLIVVGVAAAYVFHAMSGVDLPTSLVALAPGGFSELSVLARELDVQTELVVAVHLVRKLVILAFMGGLLIVVGLAS